MQAFLRRMTLAGLLAGAQASGAIEITLPGDVAGFLPKPHPGHALAEAHCLTCHSSDYVRYQPPSSNRGYWERTVRKMNEAFGATIPEGDIPALVDYLVRTYGDESIAPELPQRP